MVVLVVGMGWGAGEGQGKMNQAPLRPLGRLWGLVEKTTQPLLLHVLVTELPAFLYLQLLGTHFKIKAWLVHDVGCPEIKPLQCSKELGPFTPLFLKSFKARCLPRPFQLL